MIGSLWKEIPFRYPKLLRFFEEISAIPRESYHEERIADYLVAFALERGLPCFRDNLHNVFIEMPASAGYEDHAPLLLQGHTDMVCEKNAGVEHDFATDPLDLYVEDGWLRARGTTLGADDGVAIAIMLSILDGDIAAHPPIQCLFTSAEEVSMGGIEGFDFSRVTARRMINLDSPDELEVIAGCAGALYERLALTKPGIPVHGDLLRLSVTGLAGGHSGEDIHLGRTNAIRLLGRVLFAVSQATPTSLVSVTGGNKKNAIPREAEAVIVPESLDAALATVQQLRTLIASEMAAEDRSVRLEAEPMHSALTDAMSAEDSARLFLAMTLLPCGVLEQNRVIGGVALSCNLGVIETQKSDAHLTVSMSLMARSDDEARMDSVCATVSALADVLEGTATEEGRFLGWEYAEHSALREAFAKACDAVVQKKPTVRVIHAGLECGTVKREIPDMDMISCGPQVRALHSPDEALHLASFERFFAIMEHLLEAL